MKKFFFLILFTVFSFLPLYVADVLAAKCSCNLQFSSKSSDPNIVPCTLNKTKEFPLCSSVNLSGLANDLDTCEVGKVIFGAEAEILPSTIQVNDSGCAAMSKSGGDKINIPIYGEINYTYDFKCQVIGQPVDNEKVCPVKAPSNVNCPKLTESLNCDKPENLQKCQDTCNNQSENQCIWNTANNSCVKKVLGAGGVSQQDAAKMYQDKFYGKPEGYNGFLPDCAFTGDCDDVNDLLQLAIGIGEWIFKISGSVAFLMFVYGGFMMVLSTGNSERVKKGRDILAAAVVGLIIIFGAYMIVGFVLNTLGVTEFYDFRAAPTEGGGSSVSETTKSTQNKEEANKDEEQQAGFCVTIKGGAAACIPINGANCGDYIGEDSKPGGSIITEKPTCDALANELNTPASP